MKERRHPIVHELESKWPSTFPLQEDPVMAKKVFDASRHRITELKKAGVKLPNFLTGAERSK